MSKDQPVRERVLAMAGHGHDDHDTNPFPRPWTRMKSFFHPERGDLLVIFVYAVFVALLSLATPIAVEAMVTTVMFGVVIWPVIWLAMILCVCLSLAGIIHVAESVVIEVLQRRIFVRTVADFAHHLPRVKLEVMDNEYGPNLVNRFFDVLNVQKSSATLLLDGISILLATFVGMIVLALYHPLLLAFDLVLILSLGLIVLLGRGGVRTSLAESHAKYDVAGWLQEVARTPRLFKSGYGPEIASMRADHFVQHYIEHRRRHFRIVLRQFSAAVFVQVLVSVLLLGLGGYLVIQRQLTPGQLIASELIVSMVVAQLLKLNKYLESWYDLCTGMEKLAKVTDLPEERQTGEIPPQRDVGMSLSVEDLQYGTSRNNGGGMSWSVEPNEKVCLTGQPGAGKSMLLDVLSGFREASDGHVELDGVDLRDWRLAAVRRDVAVVRDVEILDGTILENLRLGRDDIGITQIRAVLHSVGLLDAVHALPNALETQLIQTGSPLSTGQSLRLCMARAMLRRPRLLILDGVLDRIELSVSTELLDALFSDDAPWTLLVTTHQREMWERCDRVIDLASTE